MRSNRLTGVRMHVPTTLRLSLLSLLLTMAVTPQFASGDNTSYITEYPGSKPTNVVYKSVDSFGHVTYSATWPGEKATIERISINPAPADEYVEDSRQRLHRIKETARMLAETREQREADRAEAEKMRLERLALQRSTQAQVYERKVFVGWYPLWWHHPKAHYAGRHQQHRLHSQGLSRGIPLSKGTSLR